VLALLVNEVCLFSFLVVRRLSTLRCELATVSRASICSVVLQTTGDGRKSLDTSAHLDFRLDLGARLCGKGKVVLEDDGTGWR